MLLALAAFVLRAKLAPLAASYGPRIAASAAPQPGAGPRFAPDAAIAMRPEIRPLGVSPDGVARWLVLARFSDALGAPVVLESGGDVAVAARATACGSDANPLPLDVCSNAVVSQWQTRLRFGGPAAIVSTPLAARIAIRVHAGGGLKFADAVTAIDARAAKPSVTARALGPHLVRIGWYPRATGATVRIVRDGRALALVAGDRSSFDDAGVAAGALVRYDVLVPGRARASLAVRTPPAPVAPPLDALRGSGMWLAFSASPGEADSFDVLDPRAIVDRARAAGLRRLQLRVAYGPFDEITPQSSAFVDALLDAAAANGIGVLAWTVPRGTDADDLGTALALARYRTPSGRSFAGLAVDLERGADYLGDGDSGYAALSTYLATLRAALGPAYPLIATVEDPFLEHLSDRDVPYAAIARSASVLQPMCYWRLLSKRAVTPAGAASAVRGSYAALRREAGRDVPIDVGAQTDGEGPRGAPPPAEIAAAAGAARAAGAFGITYFDWSGTSDAQWRAIATIRAPGGRGK